MFLSRINLMMNKCSSYITLLQSWNTAARKHPTENKNDPHCKKVEDPCSRMEMITPTEKELITLVIIP
jgi:hypothetical protein